ncbi:MAG: hypothetical protein HYU67_03835 [Flavobacteriia bacterium]|nr:hypothetical protein [Flavobacteriia bacterium]
MALSKKLFIGACLTFILLTQNVLANSGSRSMTAGEATGKQYFEGSIRFENDGPSCISCHSVNNAQVANGGLYAKDLTDVYTRMGEGVSAWLMAPSFPAMMTSYQNNPLTEKERKSLAEFLKYVNDTKSGQNASKGYDTMLMAGIGGFFGILVLIGLIWFKRKRNMVKEDIFSRQSKAWDAKH